MKSPYLAIFERGAVILFFRDSFCIICDSMECPCSWRCRLPCICATFVFPALSAITCQSQEINKSIVLFVMNRFEDVDKFEKCS